jgi:hypothetical protein
MGYRFQEGCHCTYFDVAPRRSFQVTTFPPLFPGGMHTQLELGQLLSHQTRMSLLASGSGGNIIRLGDPETGKCLAGPP